MGQFSVKTYNPPGSLLSATQHFAVSLYPQLPPIPGMPVEKPVTESDLADCLWSLLSAAGMNIIPAPADQPDPGSLVDQIADILHVARSLKIASDIALTEGLWTRAGPY